MIFVKTRPCGNTVVNIWGCVIFIINNFFFSPLPILGEGLGVRA